MRDCCSAEHNRLALGLNMDIDCLFDVVDLQVALWGKDFPQIKTMHSEIIEMLKMEKEKFEDTLKRGEGMVKRIAADLKAKNSSQISNETLSELYDSHGLPPEIVKQAAEVEGVAVEVPENFYSLVAGRHMQANKATEEEPAAEHALEVAVQGLTPTELMFYPEPYMREWNAKVLKVVNEQYVVLDRTCFYPEGGGQPADHGYFAYGGGCAGGSCGCAEGLAELSCTKSKPKTPYPPKAPTCVGYWIGRNATL